MNCWSWPSWQHAAGGPSGHMEQVCKLDAVLLLSSQGSFLQSNLRDREPMSQVSYLWAQQDPTLAKTRGSKDGEAPCQTFSTLSFILHYHPPSLPSSPNRQPRPLPVYAHTEYFPPAQTPTVPFSLLTPVLLCTSAICTALRAASHPALH